jgi:hypothetical protein
VTGRSFFLTKELKMSTLLKHIIPRGEDNVPVEVSKAGLEFLYPEILSWCPSQTEVTW